MKNRKGGYIIIDLENNDLTSSFTLEGVYERLEGNYGKAIQLTGITINSVEKADAFVIAKVDNSNFVIDVYGYTLTIDSDDLVTSSISTLLLSDIVDADGNKRFQEWDITDGELSGVTLSYAKASLSGSHLMFVIAGEIADTTALTGGAILGSIVLDDWINNKIYPVVGTYIELKTITTFGSGLFDTQNLSIVSSKETSAFMFRIVGNFTASADRAFRIQFDLLIDNE